MAHDGGTDDHRIGPVLDDDGMAIVALLGLRLMVADIAAQRRDATRRRKLEIRDRIVDTLAESSVTAPAGAASWRIELGQRLAGRLGLQQRAVLAAAAAAATEYVKTREQSLAVLVELATLPWPDGLAWVHSARSRCLEEIASEMRDVDPADVRRIDAEVDANLRALRREQVPWVRIAVVGVAGVALGAVTMGAAAPAIGAAIGGAAGLSGAAATSAGLALLGGGSLAAGGFGMAGGTTVLLGAGGVLGAGLGAGSARVVVHLGSGPARDVVRVAVYAAVVLAEEHRDDEELRRVVVAMEQRLVEMQTKVVRLAERLRDLDSGDRTVGADGDGSAPDVAGDDAAVPSDERHDPHEIRRRTKREYQLAKVAVAALIVALRRLTAHLEAWHGGDVR